MHCYNSLASHYALLVCGCFLGEIYTPEKGGV